MQVRKAVQDTSWVIMEAVIGEVLHWEVVLGNNKDETVQRDISQLLQGRSNCPQIPQVFVCDCIMENAISVEWSTEEPEEAEGVTEVRQ